MTTIKTIQAQADALAQKIQVAQADLSELVKIHEAAIDRVNRRQSAPQTDETGTLRSYAALNEAHGVLATAQRNEAQARRDLRSLTKQHEYLAVPLGASARIAELEQIIAIGASKVTAAEAALENAQRAQNALEDMLLDERHDAAVQQAKDADMLLKAVKNGSSTTNIGAAVNGRLAAIQTAHETAVAETTAAMGALAAAQDMLDSDRKELLEQRAHAAKLPLLLAEAAYKQALTHWREAANEASLDTDVADPRESAA